MTQSNSREPHRPGDPDIPEERNPRGHDGQPDVTTPSGQTSTAATPPLSDDAQAAPVQPSKLDDAKFLVDEFGIAERKAARSVSADDPDALAGQLQKQERQADPLSDVPTPEEPAEITIGKEGAGHLRNVIHQPNRRSGGG